MKATNEQRTGLAYMQEIAKDDGQLFVEVGCVFS
jgi:hypothetical protein